MGDYKIFIGQYGNTTNGRWCDAADVDECDAAVKEFSRDGAIEIGAFDHEGFGGIRSESVSELRALAEYLDGRADAAARLAYAAHVGITDPSDIDDQFDDAYQGEWSDEETFAEETHCEIYGEPSGPLAAYIDWERYARDLFMSDYFSVDAPRGIFVFRHY